MKVQIDEETIMKRAIINLVERGECEEVFAILNAAVFSVCMAVAEENGREAGKELMSAMHETNMGVFDEIYDEMFSTP